MKLSGFSVFLPAPSLTSAEASQVPCAQKSGAEEAG